MPTTAIVPAPISAPATPTSTWDDARQEQSWRHAFADWWGSRSPNTRRTYESQWKHWLAWCREHGAEPAPADPINVAAYIRWRGQQRKANGQLLSRATIDQIRPAIGSFHKAAGMGDPCSDARVKAAAAAVKRDPERARPLEQVDGLTLEEIRTITEMVELSQRMAARRDATWGERQRAERDAFDLALIEVMFSAGLRRSEAAALVWADIADIGEGEATITVRRSKTDQEGHGAVRFLGHKTLTRLMAIRPSDAGPDQSVFGISGSTIASRIKRCAERAGIKGRISGHSCRRGMAEELVAQGASTAEVMHEGRWSSPQMVARYTSKQDATRGAMARIQRERRS